MTAPDLAKAVVALSKAERALDKANREVRRLRATLLRHILEDHPDTMGADHASRLKELLGDQPDTEDKT